MLSEKQETWYKLAVFVPENDAEKLRNALGAAGAGKLGNYSHCSYSLKGTGRFLPEDAANPYIGTPGKAEEVAEQKVEVVFPARLKEKSWMRCEKIIRMKKSPSTFTVLKD